MPNTRKLISAALFALLVLGICLVWLLVGGEIKVLDKQVDSGAGVVAGPLAHGTFLQQEIDVPENISYEELHLGFKFATYSRKNPGQIRILVEQGDKVVEHLQESGQLKDNTTVFFSFPELEAGKALLTIQGVNGPGNHSATVWCSYSADLPSMILNGEPSDRRVDVWFAHQRIDKQVILERVGLGGLIFLSWVFFAILTTLFYRTLVEVDSWGETKKVWLCKLNSAKGRRLWVSISVSVLAGAIAMGAFLLFSEKPVNFLPVGDLYSEARVPIEPLIEGTVVKQRFEVTPQMSSGQIGLGLSFGTFLRSNKGKVELKITQGDKSDRVVLNSKTLVDGEERLFVFSQFDAGPATLTLSGINGKGSNSPTVWFEPGEQEPRAVVNGEVVPQRLILFRYLVVPGEPNAFPIKWIGGLMLIVFLLMQIRRPREATTA